MKAFAAEVKKKKVKMLSHVKNGIQEKLGNISFLPQTLYFEHSAIIKRK